MVTESNGPLPIPLSRRIAALVAALMSAIFYAIIVLAAPRFEELFQGFGADLPAITRTMLASYPWFGVFVIVGLVPAVMLLQDRGGVANRKPLIVAVVVSFVLSLISFAVFVYAMYKPVFELGSVV